MFRFFRIIIKWKKFPNTQTHFLKIPSLYKLIHSMSVIHGRENCCMQVGNCCNSALYDILFVMVPYNVNKWQQFNESSLLREWFIVFSICVVVHLVFLLTCTSWYHDQVTNIDISLEIHGSVICYGAHDCVRGRFGSVFQYICWYALMSTF